MKLANEPYTVYLVLCSVGTLGFESLWGYCSFIFNKKSLLTTGMLRVTTVVIVGLAAIIGLVYEMAKRVNAHTFGYSQ